MDDKDGDHRLLQGSRFWVIPGPLAKITRRTLPVVSYTDGHVETYECTRPGWQHSFIGATRTAFCDTHLRRAASRNARRWPRARDVLAAATHGGAAIVRSGSAPRCPSTPRWADQLHSGALEALVEHQADDGRRRDL